MASPADDEYRKLVRKALLDWRSTFSEGFWTWTLETVRTLALVNSAGLAGVAAIFASDGAAKAILGRYPSSAAFAIGLAAAAVDMYANSIGNLRRQNEISGRIEDFDKQELKPKDALTPTKTGKYAFRIAETAGWISAVAFLVGAWPFIREAFVGIFT